MKIAQRIASVVKGLAPEDMELLERLAERLRERRAVAARHDLAFWDSWAASFPEEDIRRMEEALLDCERIDEESWR